MSTDAYVVLGAIFTFLFAWGLLTPPLSYWRLEQNEFVHYTQPIGKDMSLARIGCTVYMDIPDVIEHMLSETRVIVVKEV